jgi:hypothetical protein
MDCTLINFLHLKLHPEKPPVHADQFDVPQNSLLVFNFSMCLSLYMWYMGVMVYMDCTLINFMDFLVHPEQPPVLRTEKSAADEFGRAPNPGPKENQKNKIKMTTGSNKASRRRLMSS